MCRKLWVSAIRVHRERRIVKIRLRSILDGVPRSSWTYLDHNNVRRGLFDSLKFGTKSHVDRKLRNGTNCNASQLPPFLVVYYYSCKKSPHAEQPKTTPMSEIFKTIILHCTARQIMFSATAVVLMLFQLFRLLLFRNCHSKYMKVKMYVTLNTKLLVKNIKHGNRKTTNRSMSNNTSN